MSVGCLDAGRLERMIARCASKGCASSMRHTLAASIAAGLLVLTSDCAAAAGLDRGAQLAATCAACHSRDNHDRGIPAIVGLSEERLAAAMQAFKSGERSSQIMHAVALSLSNEDISALARYFASQRKESEQR
jgi:cytochrome c553